MQNMIWLNEDTYLCEKCKVVEVDSSVLTGLCYQCFLASIVVLEQVPKNTKVI